MELCGNCILECLFIWFGIQGFKRVLIMPIKSDNSLYLHGLKLIVSFPEIRFFRWLKQKIEKKTFHLPEICLIFSFVISLFPPLLLKFLLTKCVYNSRLNFIGWVFCYFALPAMLYCVIFVFPSVQCVPQVSLFTFRSYDMRLMQLFVATVNKALLVLFSVCSDGA